MHKINNSCNDPLFLAQSLQESIVTENRSINSTPQASFMPVITESVTKMQHSIEKQYNSHHMATQAICRMFDQKKVTFQFWDEQRERIRQDKETGKWFIYFGVL